MSSSVLDIKKSLELQRWILDPTSRPYENNNKKQETENLTVHSAGEYVKYEGIPQEPKCSVEKQLEITRRILDY